MSVPSVVNSVKPEQDMSRSIRHLAGLLAAVVCLLYASSSWSAVTITIQSPSVGQLVGLSLNVSVAVTSTYQLQRVHADVETVGADLTPGSSSSDPWTGTLDVHALSRATKTLTITAT